ncbi:MAG: hypothetical protein ISF22_07170 [Methanomassiliicoccus sp.]|nr:hypothetical protein [Methanomassiliicoccus sp.]
MVTKTTHEKLSEAGKKGAAERWSSGREISDQTRAKLSEAGRRGAEAQPREAKVLGGERGAAARWSSGKEISGETRAKLSEAGKRGAAEPREGRTVNERRPSAGSTKGDGH